MLGNKLCIIRLCDSAGQPVSDGSYPVVFRLYGQATGGISLWSESQTLQTTGGVFSTMLGSGLTTPLPSSAFGGATWVETEVGGTVLSPRIQIISAGYSIRAAIAEAVPDASITNANLADGSVSAANQQERPWPIRGPACRLQYHHPVPRRSG